MLARFEAFGHRGGEAPTIASTRLSPPDDRRPIRDDLRTLLTEASGASGRHLEVIGRASLDVLLSGSIDPMSSPRASTCFEPSALNSAWNRFAFSGDRQFRPGCSMQVSFATPTPRLPSLRFQNKNCRSSKL